jgi:hypothetical protein
MKMRHYGFLSNRGKEKLKIEKLKGGKIRIEKVKIDFKEITKTKLGFDIDACPRCKTGKMITISQFSGSIDIKSLANPPPNKTNETSKSLIINK